MSYWDMLIGGLSFFWSPLIVVMLAFLGIAATVGLTLASITWAVDDWHWMSVKEKVSAIAVWLLAIPISYSLFMLFLFAITNSAPSGLHWL